MDTVSVIIPVYNSEKYIESCLNSVIKQTYPYIEVILVDDGSVDASGVICDKYAEKDQRITVYHRKNAGVSASRNFGLDHARGKYVLFVDSDDTMEGVMIEKCIQLAEGCKAELVICSFRYYILDDHRVEENSLGSDFCGSKEELFKEWFPDLIEKEILNPPWNKFVRKDLLINNRIRFNEKYSICEDMAFSIQVLSASKRTALTGGMYYNYYLKSSGTLVFKFHENYFEALTNYYKAAAEYCNSFKNNRKQLKVINTLYVNLIIMFLKQICTKSLWNKKDRYEHMRKIASNKGFIYALENADLNRKKRLVCYLLRTGHYRFIQYGFMMKNKK